MCTSRLQTRSRRRPGIAIWTGPEIFVVLNIRREVLQQLILSVDDLEGMISPATIEICNKEIVTLADTFDFILLISAESGKDKFWASNGK